MLAQLKKDLRKRANSATRKVLMRFFKTGKGQYSEGDEFLGVTVPNTRAVAVKYKDLSFEDISRILHSRIHEERLCALLLLVHKFPEHKKKVVDFYLANIKGVNNWDLVDLTAPKILGEWLLHKDRTLLYTLAKSSNVWERRIAIVATYAFIKHGEFTDTLKLSEVLLNDTHDLMHKACGWMLREVGKKDVKVLEEFLHTHSKIMPRTMLRYAIEKFPERKRQHYLKVGTISK